MSLIYLEGQLTFVEYQNIRFLRISESTLFCWTKLMLNIQKFASAARLYSDAFLSRALGMLKCYPINDFKNLVLLFNKCIRKQHILS